MKSDITVPNAVPSEFKKELLEFIQSVGGVFASFYYNPLRARIVDPDNFTTLYIVNLENGSIHIPRASKTSKPYGNLKKQRS